MIETGTYEMDGKEIEVIAVVKDQVIIEQEYTVIQMHKNTFKSFNPEKIYNLT